MKKKIPHIYIHYIHIDSPGNVSFQFFFFFFLLFVFVAQAHAFQAVLNFSVARDGFEPLFLLPLAPGCLYYRLASSTIHLDVYEPCFSCNTKGKLRSRSKKNKCISVPPILYCHTLQQANVF